MNLTGKHPYFLRGFQIGNFKNRVAIDAGISQLPEHCLSRCVSANRPDDDASGSERRHIQGTVSSAARLSNRLFISQNENRSFAGNSFDLAIEKLIRDKIANDKD